MAKKAFLIGIDGATFDIIKPLVKKGELPNIAKLIKEGTSGNLTSTFPSMTIPAWPAAITGVNPGKLGVSSFIRNTHTYEPDWVVSSNDIKAKSIWNYLEQAGKKSIVVNIPYLYPPQKINGIMVAYFNARGIGDKISAYPSEISKELFDVLDLDSLMKNRRNFSYVSIFSRYGNKSSKEFWLDQLVDFHRIAVEKLREGTLYLMGKYEWDFFMVVFNSTDFLQHKLICFIDKDNPAYDEELSKKYYNEIFDCYKRIDKAIGDILRKLDKDTSVVIISDHGFSTLKKKFFVNKWLIANGLLCLNSSKYKITLLKVPLFGILTKLGMLKIIHFLPEKIKNMHIPIIWRKKKSFSEIIDWKKTKAYSHSDTINVNLKGREPAGIVNNEEYWNVINFIKKELSVLKDDKTGMAIVDKIYEKSEIYSGPFVDNASDLQFFFNSPNYGISTKLFGGRGFFEQITKEDKVVGVHQSANQGIFIAYGTEIDNGRTPNTPHIMDITPTILYLLGLPIPEEMDGRVLTDIIRAEYLGKNQIQYTKENIFRENVEKGAESFTKEESQRIMNALKNLGYFG
ncbi:MAG TPA: alkaline phosphatase family protein [Candidatus Wujingus californicus]|uniref:alkaline phosphatase family protein n=1 Tax=Candidatus Wujingus californicus TaxID=3367618 RepID=UPI001DB99C88|nr:alkaline phosphatase family protein [Planctomycetota bacterium]MDO8130481.1 alkaline phosphatase family protein [Candidatus Brocadiales bacterium]